jgi:TRAP-type C4-dicarboxylate transport system substrate-binding protein
MHAWLPKNAVIVNTKSFDSLDGASQKAVLDAAALAEQRGWKVSEEKTQWFVEQLRSKGMEISPPSARLTEDMAKIGAQLQVEWTERMKKSNADGEGILNAFMGR